MSARPAWVALLVAALVGAVLAAALGGCPRMRTLAGTASGSSHRHLAAFVPGTSQGLPAVSGPGSSPGSLVVSGSGSSPGRSGVSGSGSPRGPLVALASRAVVSGVQQTAGSHCQGAKAVAAVAPDSAPRAQACVSCEVRGKAPTSALSPSPEPPVLGRVSGGRPEVLLRV
ncbi:hypothetical protein Shyhy01_76230 [Streptomyces hygroscopicus subsp. hygroscopicus]|nr:hypothetical protein [Streptomyces hygroscopicus]GLX54674.1 hypothetical protein Shyhy01_76230 [Streptomyces hygroscopicus subsp. hygroscopicus]